MKNRKTCSLRIEQSLEPRGQINNPGSDSFEFEGIRAGDAQRCFEQAPPKVQAQTLFTIEQGSL